MTKTIFPKTEEELPFVLHEHTIGNKVDYQLSVQTNDNGLQFLKFPRTGNMATLSDQPNVTRLFGTLSDNTRTEAWLTFKGQTTEPESGNQPGVYDIMERGVLKIGQQTAKFSEVFLNSQNLSDRWILHKIPNIFDEIVFPDSKEVILLWKPPRQKQYQDAFSKNVEYNDIQCPCPVRDSSAKFHELVREEGEELMTKMTSDIMFDRESQTFEGVESAEGTWIDLYGEKYTYTPEFIIHHFNEQKQRLAKGGVIKMGTLHGDITDFQGSIDSVELYREPIYHIRVKGVYKGPIDLDEGNYGLSHEARLKSVWNHKFQSWVPYASTTERVDVVKRPACKICWINKVNKQEYG